MGRLKRCQIMLEDWQINYIRTVAKKSFSSMSSVVRFIINKGILHGKYYADEDKMSFEARKKVERR